MLCQRRTPTERPKGGSFGFGFAGKQFGAGDGPLGQDAGVNHNMAHAFDQQGLEAQPFEHFFAVGMLEDGGDGVAALDRAFAVADGTDTLWLVGDIVKLNAYLTDLANFAVFNEVMAEFIQEPFPARAAVGVASLPKGVQVEAEAVLVLNA